MEEIHQLGWLGWNKIQQPVQVVNSERFMISTGWPDLFHLSIFISSLESRHVLCDEEQDQDRDGKVEEIDGLRIAIWRCQPHQVRFFGYQKAIKKLPLAQLRQRQHAAVMTSHKNTSPGINCELRRLAFQALFWP